MTTRAVRLGAVIAGLALAAARGDCREVWPPAIAGCDALVRAHPAEWRAYACYGEVARRLGSWTEAVASLEELLRRQADNQYARLALAGVERDRGHPRVEPLLREAAQGFADGDDPAGEVRARLGLAQLLRFAGRLAEAEREIERARALAVETAIPELLLAVELETGWLAFNRADYAAADACFRGVEARIAQDVPGYLRASVLSGLGSVRWATGRHRESYANYLLLAEQHEIDGDLYAVAGDRYSIALLASFLVGDGVVTVAELRELQREALAAALRGGNRGAEAAVRLTLSEDVSLTLAERIQHAERALAIAKVLGDIDKTCYALRLLAYLRLEVEPGRPEVASGPLEEAVARARDAGSPHHIARGLLMRGYLRWKTGPPDGAYRDSLAAFDAIERIRDLQRDELVRARTAAQWAFFYYRVSGFLLRVRQTPEFADIDRAFSVMERLRGRVLLDALDAARATSELSRGPFQEERDVVLARIAATQGRLSDASLSRDERDRVLEQLAREEAEETALRDRAASVDPGFRALRRPTLPGVADVQRALADDEALLAFQLSSRRVDEVTYFFDNGGSWLIVVTRGGVSAYPLADEDVIEDAIDLFLGLVQRRDGSETRGAARLYRELLADALRDLDPRVRRLVIVPDKALFRIPLEVLRGSEEEPPVGARYQLAMAPSAALWLRWRDRPAVRAPVPALVLADPELPAAGVSPGAARRWTRRSAGRMGSLPHARAEARRIVRLLGGGSRALVGGEATEAFLKTAELERFGLLHVAAHAVIDDQRPEQSAILLAPGDPAQDGLLQVREVVSLPLSSRVVVLAACRSSAGELLHGEGVMSLARGFFQAGASTVVGSVWPLRDDETEVVCAAFYRHLGRGWSVARALAAARRERIAAGDPAAAWAGLVVMGDGDAVPLPGGRGGVPAFVVVGIIVAGLLGVAIAVIFLRRR